MTRLYKYLIIILLGALAWNAGAQPVNPDYQAGVTNYHNSDWDGTISNFTKTIEANYDLYDSYSYRAYCLAKKGDSNGAVADCKQLVALAPKWAGSYYWCSRVALASTNYEGALRTFETGLRMDPATRPDDLRERLMNHYMDLYFEAAQASKLDVALSEIDKVIDIDPTNSPSHFTRAWLRIMQGRFDVAILDADFAIQYNPKSPNAYGALAWARCGRGDASGAAEACQKEIDAWEEFFAKRPQAREHAADEVLIPQGLLCYVKNDFSGAVDNWEKYMKKHGNEMPQLWQTFFQSWIDKAKAKK